MPPLSGMRRTAVTARRLRAVARCVASGFNTGASDTYDGTLTGAKLTYSVNDAAAANVEGADITVDVKTLGDNTVSFSGQSARMCMCEEIMAKMDDASDDGSTLVDMFQGTGVFAHPLAEGLKDSKKLSSTVGAASRMNAEVASKLEEILSSRNGMDLTATASANGTAGVLGGRILNSQGYEIDQVFMKSCIGALCADQIINKYLGDLDPEFLQ